jgi:hypothetical protein
MTGSMTLLPHSAPPDRNVTALIASKKNRKEVNGFCMATQEPGAAVPAPSDRTARLRASGDSALSRS